VAADRSAPSSSASFGTPRCRHRGSQFRRTQDSTEEVSKEHPRIELLRYKGVVAMRSWPPGPWLASAEAKRRIEEFLHTAAPLVDWLTTHVGADEGPSTETTPCEQWAGMGQPRDSGMSGRFNQISDLRTLRSSPEIDVA